MSDIKEWDMDDFRRAMHIIVHNHDNDDIFTKNLSNVTGHGSEGKNIEPESKKNYMSSISMIERKRHSIIDRTSP